MEAVSPLPGTRPSLLVRAFMAPMTRVLNPRIVKRAGRPGFRMAAQIHHVGRRTGRRYVTPAGARLHEDQFVIPLTFGTTSDWSRNVRAAGQCTIRLDGADHLAIQPELLTAAQARPLLRSAFSPLERATFRMLGIRHFLVLQDAGNTGPRRG